MLYGRLSFNGYGQEESRNVKYMIADTSRQRNEEKGDIKNTILNDVGNKLIERVACKAWRQVLSDSVVPKLVISVTGGARDFKMSERHLEAFKRGLIKAATTTDTWIVTGGTQNGVMQVVGDAVKDYMLEDGAYKQALVVVGIATLGVIAHSDDLVRHAGKVGDTQECYIYHNPVMLDNMAREKKREKCFQISLDPHHTHFVLVDDGSKNQFGREINVRAAFEQHRDDIAEKGKGGVPVVLLMLEGGINTLQTACEAIEAGTPVVVMQGSGRAADFVVECSPYVKAGDMAKLKLAAEEWLTGYDVERGVKYVCTLLNPLYNDFLNLFMQSEDTSGDELAEVILKAILRASLHANADETSKESAVKFMELSLSFNRCDIAKQEIHKNNLVFSRFTLEAFFLSSITQNKSHFPEMFIEMGVNVNDCISHKSLNQLYLDTLQNAKPGTFEDLFKACVLPLSKSEDNILPGVSRMLQKLTNYQLIEFYSENELTDACNDLFIFSLLLHRGFTAKTFWRLCQDPIGAALTASRILRAFSKVCLKRFERFDLARQLEFEASHFEEEARSILTHCSLINNESCRLLLIRSLPYWGGLSVMDVVEEGQLMDFADHDVFQTQLNVIWYGGIMSHTDTWKLLFGLFLPFVMVWFIEFRKKDSSNQVNPGNNLKNIERSSSFLSTSTIVSNASSRPSAPSYETSLSYIFLRPDNQSVNFFSRMYLFFTAPIVKFSYHTVSYLCFLLLFTYFLLADLKKNYISWSEIVVYIWELSYWLDELRQLVNETRPFLWMKALKHFSDQWNIFQQLISIPLIITIILRLNQSYFDVSHHLLSLILLLCILKLLRFFYVQSYVGPKVIMIQEMLFDLMFFLLIFAVFLFAYGVTSFSFLYPTAPPSWHTFFQVLFDPYFAIFGEFNLNKLLGNVDNCVTNNTLYLKNPYQYPLCSTYSHTALLLFCAYVIITCVLLVNLLVAVFSYTFTKIEDSAFRTWRFHRISLVREFAHVSALVPPLSIISLIISSLIYIFKKITRIIKKEKHDKREDVFRVEYGFEEIKRRRALERRGLKEYLSKPKSNIDVIPSKIQTMEKKVELILAEIWHLKEFLNEK